uniref:Uncharacterized protein n=1 Tax=Arundo donax TaxID=35708 RepID=A0A0A9AD21_ARUDO
MTLIFATMRKEYFPRE